MTTPHDPPLRLVVIGDSLVFHNHEQRVPLDDARMYPNLLAAELSERTGRAVDLTICARAGWITRDGWELVTKDPWFQQRILPDADIIVYNLSGGDALPVGLPSWVKDLIPSVTHAPTRTRLRKLYWQSHRHLVSLTGARLRNVGRDVSRDLWGRTVDMLRFYSNGAIVLAGGATPTHAAHHGNVDPHSVTHNNDLRELAAARNVGFVDLGAIGAADLDRVNPADGMHWHDDVHVIVAHAFCDLAIAELAARDAARTDIAATADSAAGERGDGEDAPILR